MKHLLICVSVLAAVSVASAKSFTTGATLKRNPAQTGNIGPAEDKPLSPATAECKFAVNGSNGPAEYINLAVKGSETTGNLDISATTSLSGGSDISTKINIMQVHGTSYVSTIWLTDEVTGVQTLQQDLIDFPETMMSSSTSAMLLFSKNPKNIKLGGKKLQMNNVLVICSLNRKNTI